MLIIPKVIRDDSPSCCYLNDRRNMMCVVKDLYDLMNINYDYLSSGIVDEVVEEIIPLLPEIEVDASIATEDQVDTLFP